VRAGDLSEPGRQPGRREKIGKIGRKKRQKKIPRKLILGIGGIG
jgi:hypothetical protein